MAGGERKRKSRNFGHINGVNTVKKIVQYALQNKIPILSFYVFSTENWKRPKTEIKFLFNLINTYFKKKEIESVMKNKIRIKIIGNLRKLPLNLVKNLKKITNLTKKNKNIIVNLALNYGSKNEITETVNKLIKNKITINEKNIENQLYTKGMPLPDILVRTGGQNRLSNFMLWQLAYSEIYFKKKLWPDFNEKDLKEIIRDYKNEEKLW